MVSAYNILEKQIDEIEECEETKDYVEGMIAMAYLLHSINGKEWNSLNRKLEDKL